MDEGESKFDIRPILRLVADGKWVLVAGALAGGLLFALQAFLLAGPVYRATAVVILDTRSEEIIGAGAIVAGLSGEVTEINTEIEVLRGRELLGRVVDELGLVSDPEFNGALVEDPWTAQARRTVREAILGPPPPRGEGWEREATLSALQARIAVQAVPASYVFRITASAGDPMKAARIADAVAEAYIEGQIAAKAAAVDAATAALAGRVYELEAELVEAEARLAGMVAAQDALTPDDLVGLDRALTETRESLLALEGEIAALPQDGDSDAAARRATLVADEAVLTARAAAMAASERRIDQTWREVEVTRALYEDFLSRLKETAVQRELIRPDARVLSAAVPPAVHASPRRAQTMTMGVILGLVVAGGALLLREGMVRTFRSVEEVERATGRRVLSALPEMPGETGRDLLRALAERPLSPEAEAVRQLRTALALEPGGPLPGVIMLTSALPGEGKTTLAAALAQNLAAVGLSVVLVETDLRRRAFAAFFGTSRSDGIVSVIHAELGAEEAIFAADPWGFDVMAGITGTQAGLPDLLASDRFADVMAVLRTGYDVVLLDTTPLLTAPDAQIVGRHAEAVIHCLRWNATTREETRAALRLLHGIGRGPAGIVLTRVEVRRPGRLF
jgi:succinoglycan biosynthesis transport protein ExoP